MSDQQHGGERFLCRCEELTEDDVRQALAAGAVTINDLKRRTRFGMGLCQGAYCLCLLSDLMEREQGAPADGVAPMTPRPPVRLISVDALAKLES